MTEYKDTHVKDTCTAVYVQTDAPAQAAELLKNKLGVKILPGLPDENHTAPYLRLNADGLALVGNDQTLYGDFSRMLTRIKPNNLNGELLVKASRIKGANGVLTAVDATAGLGEDAFLLSAAGFNVRLYERDTVIAALLLDALRRAAGVPQLSDICSRMQLFCGDSVSALPNFAVAPDVVLLDPMFPERRKSALIKKKFQLLQQLEKPCSDEKALLDAALSSGARRIVIKRPVNGEFLAGRRPDYSLKGKTIRYDCIVL